MTLGEGVTEDKELKLEDKVEDGDRLELGDGLIEEVGDGVGLGEG